MPEIVGSTRLIGARRVIVGVGSEAATVGPVDFMFTTAEDVIRVHDVPSEFAAVLTGHIHRHQVLTTDLRHRPIATPVLYPGSIERTSVAEIGEQKGFMVVDVEQSGRESRVRWQFRRLPARPMIRHETSRTAEAEPVAQLALL